MFKNNSSSLKKKNKNVIESLPRVRTRVFPSLPDRKQNEPVRSRSIIDHRVTDGRTVVARRSVCVDRFLKLLVLLLFFFSPLFSLFFSSPSPVRPALRSPRSTRPSIVLGDALTTRPETSFISRSGAARAPQDIRVGTSRSAWVTGWVVARCERMVATT